MTESEEKAKLLKDALKIVDELATFGFQDTDDLIHSEYELSLLVKRAKNLKRNRLWKLN